MKTDEVNIGDWLMIGSAVGLFVVSFLPWYGFGPLTHTAWDNIWSALGIMFGLLVGIIVGTQRISPIELPRPKGIAPEVVFMLGSVLAMVFILIQLVLGVQIATPDGVVGLDRDYGLWLALAFSVVMFIGSSLNLTDESFSPFNERAGG